jgi:hypothetical protein
LTWILILLGISGLSIQAGPNWFIRVDNSTASDLSGENVLSLGTDLRTDPWTWYDLDNSECSFAQFAAGEYNSKTWRLDNILSLIKNKTGVDSSGQINSQGLFICLWNGAEAQLVNIVITR